MTVTLMIMQSYYGAVNVVTVWNKNNISRKHKQRESGAVRCNRAETCEHVCVWAVIST